jgi:aminoglycoside 2''-phosphotransferase
MEQNRNVRSLGSGFDNIVSETEDGRVLRKARSPRERDTLARQFKFLPRLAKRLPVPIPIPESFENDELAYRKIPGEVLSPSILDRGAAHQLTCDIAAFLNALHSVAVVDCVSWGVPQRGRTEELLDLLEESRPALNVRQRSQISAWRKHFSAHDHTPTLIHGDLWYENMLVDRDSGRLTGILDFDRACIGDPAWDIATQLHCGDDFARAVFDRYHGGTEDLWIRAHRLFPLRAFEGLAWAIRNSDEAEFEESLGKLRACGVLE